MARKRLSAEQRLDEMFMVLSHENTFGDKDGEAHENNMRTYRRRKRALRVELANAACDSADECWTGGASRVLKDAIRAAVLGRRK